MTTHEFVRGNRGKSYNIGWTISEIELMVKLIDDEEDLTDGEEADLLGIRRKLLHKRKVLKARVRNATS